jgi:transcriptional regulator with XRE-family HTH domain
MSNERAFRNELRARRETRGWSQLQLAMAVRRTAVKLGWREPAIDGNAVSRWERGDQLPSPAYQDLICLTLGVQARELGLQTTGQTPRDASPRTVDQALTLLTELTPAATADPVQRGLSGRRVGMDAVAWVEDRVLHLSRLDDLLGGNFCLGLADPAFGLVVTLLKRARYDDTTGKSLSRAAAMLARFAGWVASDAGAHPDAQRYLGAALEAARAAEDHDLMAYIQSNMALDALYSGSPARAIEILEAASDDIRDSASLAVRAMLLAWQVRPQSLIGDHRRATRLLDQADHLWDHRTQADDPAWIYWMCRPSLTAEVGMAFLAMHQPARAERLLTDGVDLLAPDMGRNRLLYLIAIARARLSQGHHEEALSTILEVLGVAGTLVCSTRVNQELSALLASMPELRLFDEARERAHLFNGMP